MSESEQALASKLWQKVPEGSLLIGDRLFGAPYTLWGAINAWGDRDVRMLVRVRDNINAELLQHLPDGSAMVEVVVREEGRKVGKFAATGDTSPGCGGEWQALQAAVVDHAAGFGALSS